MFRSNHQIHFRKTRSRVIKELFVFVLTISLFQFPLMNLIPFWLKATIIVLMAGYIVIGLLLYPKSKAISESFTLDFSDDHLEFKFEDEVRKILYKDLELQNVRREDDDVIEIVMKTSFGQSLSISNFEGMNELLIKLQEKLSSEK